MVEGRASNSLQLQSNSSNRDKLQQTKTVKNIYAESKRILISKVIIIIIIPLNIININIRIIYIIS